MEQELSKEEHAAYRTMVGKLQWMTYTRPDIGFAPKEVASAFTQPTRADQKKLKHLLRYIKGIDSDWAGCATTRKSTTGFLIKAFGATIHYGSRTQATIALSCVKQNFMQSTPGQQKHSTSAIY